VRERNIEQVLSISCLQFLTSQPRSHPNLARENAMDAVTRHASPVSLVYHHCLRFFRCACFFFLARFAALRAFFFSNQFSPAIHSRHCMV